MMTLIMITVVIWTFIRTLQFVIRLWRLADGAISPRIGVVAAAQS
jgi:hypothetical protein